MGWSRGQLASWRCFVLIRCVPPTVKQHDRLVRAVRDRRCELRSRRMHSGDNPSPREIAHVPIDKPCASELLQVDRKGGFADRLRNLMGGGPGPAGVRLRQSVSPHKSSALSATAPERGRSTSCAASTRKSTSARDGGHVSSHSPAPAGGRARKEFAGSTSSAFSTYGQGAKHHHAASCAMCACRGHYCTMAIALTTPVHAEHAHSTPSTAAVRRRCCHVVNDRRSLICESFSRPRLRPLLPPLADRHIRHRRCASAALTELVGTNILMLIRLH